jgi:cyanophycinase
VITSLLLFSVLPKSGAFLLVGGGRTSSEMAKAFADLCGGYSGEIVVLPQVHIKPEDGEKSVKFLTKCGFTRVFLVKNAEFTDADRDALESRLTKASGIWVPGGSQALFIKRFGLEWCQRVFPKLINQGVNWFGTSAGAMMVGNPMLDGDKITEGIGLIDGIVDTHYLVRHREMRLRKAYFSCKVQYGFGLDEGEWIILRDNLIEKMVGSPQIFLRE